jgi:hypothetical protein
MSFAQAPALAAEAAVCRSCSAARNGAYCSACGERAVDPHDLTVSHFLHQALHELLHVDGKIFRTLKTLIAHPGKLTADYFEGRRLPYVNPLRLLLVLFAVYVFLYTYTEKTSMYNIRNLAKKGASTEALLQQMAKKHNTNPEAVSEAIENDFHHAMGWTMLMLPILIGAGLQLVYRRRYYVEQLVFAIHLTAFVLCWAVIVYPVVLVVGLPRLTQGGVLTGTTLLLVASYLFLASRRFYGESRRATIAKSIYGMIIFYASNMFFFLASFVYAVRHVMHYGK